MLCFLPWFLGFPCKCKARTFLGCFGVFSVFSKDFEGSTGTLGNCWVFLDRHPKTMEKKDRVEENKEHPKTQHTRKRRFSEGSSSCVVGCVAFSGALWRLPNREQNYGRQTKMFWTNYIWDPDCLVQGPNSCFSPKIDKGRSQYSFRSRARETPKLSLALEQPRLAPVQPWGCSSARDNFGTLRPRPEKTTCSFPYRFSGKNRNSGLVPGNRDPKYNLKLQL